MCLIARHLEAQGTPTLCLSSAKDITASGNAPRAAFVDYPLGHTTGRPFAPDEQLAILRGALAGFSTISNAGTIIDLGYRWADSDTWKGEATDASSGDQRQTRDLTPRYQHPEDKLAAEAATS